MCIGHNRQSEFMLLNWFIDIHGTTRRRLRYFPLSLAAEFVRYLLVGNWKSLPPQKYSITVLRGGQMFDRPYAPQPKLTPNAMRGLDCLARRFNRSGCIDKRKTWRENEKTTDVSGPQPPRTNSSPVGTATTPLECVDARNPRHLFQHVKLEGSKLIPSRLSIAMNRDAPHYWSPTGLSVTMSIWHSK